LGCLVVLGVNAQENGFSILSNKDKITIPFTSINNLIFLEVNINDVPMVFLLDSGVDKTILFSLEEVGEVKFSEAEKATFRGLGSNMESVEGLKTTKNKVAIAEYFVDSNLDIYIILDQEFNISSGLGVPVNGILGYEFFKKHVIEIDYAHNKIHVYDNLSQIQKKIDKKFEKLNISIENNKPYLKAAIVLNNYSKDTLKLLIDTGNGDAVWLFQNKIPEATIPENNFDDFLGRGFNGEVHGKRAKLDRVSFHKYTFKQPYVAFPDTLSIQNVRMAQDRAGSIGSELLRRFTVVLDYQRESIYLRPNSQYDEPFRFNMSGIEVQHSGVQWVKVRDVANDSNREKNLLEDILEGFNYKLELKPIYKIYSLRPNSPAAIAGLQKDDEIISINGKKAHTYSLQRIKNLLQSEEGKKIKMEVKRNNVILKFNFYLKSIL
jgi:hypothetical protein